MLFWEKKYFRWFAIRSFLHFSRKSNDFIENDKFANKKGKGVLFGKKQYFRWFAVSAYPPGLVQAGPDRSRQVRTCLLDWPWQVRTCPNDDFFMKMLRFGFRNDFLE